MPRDYLLICTHDRPSIIEIGTSVMHLQQATRHGQRRDHRVATLPPRTSKELGADLHSSEVTV